MIPAAPSGMKNNRFSLSFSRPHLDPQTGRPQRSERRPCGAHPACADRAARCTFATEPGPARLAAAPAQRGFADNGASGALVFMIGTLAGMAGGFLALLAIPGGAAARAAEEEEIG